MDIQQLETLVEERNTQLSIRWAVTDRTGRKLKAEIRTSFGLVDLSVLMKLTGATIEELAVLVDRFIALVFVARDSSSPHPNDVSSACYLFMIHALEPGLGYQLAELVSGIQFSSARNLSTCVSAIIESARLKKTIGPVIGEPLHVGTIQAFVPVPNTLKEQESVVLMTHKNVTNLLIPGFKGVIKLVDPADPFNTYFVDFRPYGSGWVAHDDIVKESNAAEFGIELTDKGEEQNPRE